MSKSSKQMEELSKRLKDCLEVTEKECKRLESKLKKNKQNDNDHDGLIKENVSKIKD